jgi:hypothetical protein
MNETQQRKLSIARELATWGTDMPVLMARIAEVLKSRSIPGRQKLDFEVMARRITTAFNAIGETPDAEASEVKLYKQLIERTNDLRELIATTDASLDRVLKPA